MTYTISYEKNGVYQAIGVNAQTSEQATAYFTQYNPAARFIGIREGMENKPGFPVITVPDDFQVSAEIVEEEPDEIAMQFLSAKMALDRLVELFSDDRYIAETLTELKTSLEIIEDGVAI